MPFKGQRESKDKHIWDPIPSHALLFQKYSMSESPIRNSSGNCYQKAHSDELKGPHCVALFICSVMIICGHHLFPKPHLRHFLCQVVLVALSIIQRSNSNIASQPPSAYHPCPPPLTNFSVLFLALFSCPSISTTLSFSPKQPQNTALEKQ